MLYLRQGALGWDLAWAFFVNYYEYVPALPRFLIGSGFEVSAVRSSQVQKKLLSLQLASGLDLFICPSPFVVFSRKNFYCVGRVGC